MAMTKLLTISWIPSKDPLQALRAEHARQLKLLIMELDGKTLDHRKHPMVGPNTKQRCWRDQEAADEFINFMHKLSDRYGGTVIVGELIDI